MCSTTVPLLQLLCCPMAGEGPHVRTSTPPDQETPPGSCCCSCPLAPPASWASGTNAPRSPQMARGPAPAAAAAPRQQRAPCSRMLQGQSRAGRQHSQLLLLVIPLAARGMSKKLLSVPLQMPILCMCLSAKAGNQVMMRTMDGRQMQLRVQGWLPCMKRWHLYAKCSRAGAVTVQIPQGKPLPAPLQLPAYSGSSRHTGVSQLKGLVL
jgi:hypothetical protein